MGDFFANELVCLGQGVGDIVKVYDTIFYLAHEKITTDRRKDITYVQFFCNYTPQRDKTFQTRLVPRGNLISFPDYVITRIEDITAQKILFNITISTKGAWFPCCDIKTYLGTPLDRYEYIRLLLKFRPE